MESAEHREITAPQLHWVPGLSSLLATLSPTPPSPATQGWPIEPFSGAAAPLLASAAFIDHRKSCVESGNAHAATGIHHQIKGHGVLIIGTGTIARSVRTYLTNLPRTSYDFRGFAATSHQIFQTRCTDAEQVSSATDIIALARSRFVDEVIFAERPSRELEADLLSEAAPHSINIRFIPDISETLRAPHTLEYISDLPTILLQKSPTHLAARLIKRVLDVLLTTVGLTVLSPLLLLIALAVRIDSAGPIFYTSPRIGQKGRVIYCHKFRTMVPDAAALLSSVAHLNDRASILFKIKKDPRLTRVGPFLRKYSLDELPQLWNVLRGEMSLVGPRPCIESEVAQYQTSHYRRLDVPPGLTGLWQVEARCDPSFDSYIQLDSKYVNEWSVWLDLKLLARTIVVVVMGTGV